MVSVLFFLGMPKHNWRIKGGGGGINGRNTKPLRHKNFQRQDQHLGAGGRGEAGGQIVKTLAWRD